ncbi:MAG: 30S ribosome-binding factor RbfA [Clostridiales Family XIII bacterium]|jgi:phosphoesterase RecJ-like protein|nr:30S ribosome-binding factor RbfA [Clostridiales Family XIII bacterium]
MRKNYRGNRIGEEIRRIISELLLRELKDPRFRGLPTITGVKAADDGSFATVFITMLASASDSEAAEQEKKDVLAAFEAAKGLIRHEIGSRLTLRRTPDLNFVFDASSEYGRRIEEVLDDIGLGTLGRPGADTPRRIAEALNAAEKIYLFPHENPDGDTLGSCIGLCLILRDLGKDVKVILDEKIPDNLGFIENGCVTPPEDLPGADLSVLVDVSETARIGEAREALFLLGKRSMCIDHHVSSAPNFDYNLLDTEAAASAEIIFDIAEHLGDISEAAAEALYVGIVTDTGRFQYSNTTAKTHDIVATLIEVGVNPNKVFLEIFQNERFEKMKLMNLVLSNAQPIAGGRGIIAYMTQKMLEESGALDEETDGIVETLRSIRGVEVSVFVRETTKGGTKVSMRSKSSYNVAAVAETFGGGGHVNAAGYKTEKKVADVVEALRVQIGETL